MSDKAEIRDYLNKIMLEIANARYDCSLCGKKVKQDGLMHYMIDGVLTMMPYCVQCGRKKNK